MKYEGPIKVLVVENNREATKTFRKLLQVIDDVSVTDFLKTAADALDMIRKNEPDILLVEENLPDINGIRFTEMIHKEFTSMQIIVVSQERNYDSVLKAFRTGAFDFLTHDVSVEELSDAIKRAVEQTQLEKKTGGYPFAFSDTIEATKKTEASEIPIDTGGRVISIYSPKGGVGVTTLAVNLALALRENDADIALVDGCMQFGDVAMLFNEIGHLSVLDLAPRVFDLDSKMVKDVMLHHRSSGLLILPAPTQIELSETITGDQFGRILDFMRHLFKYVVVNTDSFLDDSSLASLDAGEVNILVVSQEITAIKAVRSFLEIWDMFGLPRERIMLVINQYDEGNPITRKKISATLNLPVAAVIPEDRPGCLKAANLGIPILLSNKTSPVSRAIQDLAELIHKKSDGLQSEGRFRLFMKN